ncbi:MAG: RICIN domain-containing protein [Oligoflexus sp.]|nr:RICIN domain-containing protein [Oligoflexus sp.]
MISRSLSILAASAFSLLLGAGSSPRAAAQSAVKPQSLTPGKVYQLVSKFSGKCLDVTDHSFAVNVQLQQWNCTANSNQKFRLEDAGDKSFHLIAQEANRYLRVGSDHLTNGAWIVQSVDGSGDSPRMFITPSHGDSFKVKFKLSNKCLDIDGPTLKAGAKAQQWECHDGANQDWQFVEQTEGLGQVAWSLDGTSLTKDTENRLYRQRYTNDAVEFFAVDKSTGKDRWSYRSTEFDSFYPECSDAKHMFILSKGKLKALNAETGKLDWTFDSQELQSGLVCPYGTKLLTLVNFSSGGKSILVNRETGKSQWTYTANGSLSIVGSTSQSLLLNIQGDSQSSFVSLDLKKGAVQWTNYSGGGERMSVSAKGEMFLFKNNAVEKIDPNNGLTLWTYVGDASTQPGYLDLDSTSSLLYVRQNRSIRRLSPDGVELWNLTLPQDAVNGNFQILANGFIAQIVPNQSSTETSVALINPDGQKLWDKTMASTYVNPIFISKTSKFYLRSDRNLASVDLMSGVVQWTFARELPLANETLFAVEFFDQDIILAYGGAPSRYPPMGIIRIDANTGALQWDRWLNVSTSIVHVENGLLFTNRVMGTGSSAFKL